MHPIITTLQRTANHAGQQGRGPSKNRCHAAEVTLQWTLFTDKLRTVDWHLATDGSAGQAVPDTLLFNGEEAKSTQ